MTNHKSAAYHVAIMWAAKANQRYADTKRTQWFADEIVPADHDAFQLVSKWDATLAPPMSLCMQRGLLPDVPISARHLVSFTRARQTIATGDWILVTIGDVPIVGRIREMMQAHVATHDNGVASVLNVVRMMLAHCVKPVFDEQDMVVVSCASGPVMVVPVESAHISCLICVEHGDATVRLRMS
jgi:hypothetical protein